MRINLKYQKLSNQGFSLLEVVLSLGIFAILVTDVTGLALGSFSFFSYSQSYDRAEELASEAEVAVRAIGTDSFDNLIVGQKIIKLDADGKRWIFAEDGETELLDGIYARTINITPVYRDAERNLVASNTPGSLEDVYSRNIEINIIWKSDRDAEQNVNKTILLTNWRNVRALVNGTSTEESVAPPDELSGYWLQNNWEGGAGQAFYQDSTKYGLAENLATSSFELPGLRLDQVDGTYEIYGSLVSSAFFATSGEFMNLSWQASSSCPNCLVKVWLSFAPGDINGFSEIFSDWLGPNCENDSDYYSISSGSTINMGATHAGKQWIRYKVRLESDGSDTPILNAISISYKK